MGKQWHPNICAHQFNMLDISISKSSFVRKILASSTIDWKIQKQNRVHQSMWHFQFIYTIIHLVELDPIIAQFKSIWILFNYIHVALAFRTHTHHGGLEVIHILHKTQWKCARIYENLPCVMCCAQYFADGKTIQVVVISICDVFFVNWVFNLIIPWSNFFSSLSSFR